jgi:predicted ArsR family transcriptional regulator
VTQQLPVHRALADPRRVAVLSALEEGGPQDAAGLARRVGIHANTARWHLAILEDAGLVRSSAEHRTTPGRPRRVWAARRLRDAAAQQRELSRALVAVAAGSAHAGADAQEAGRTWGREATRQSSSGRDRGIGELVRVLDEHGFEPRADGLEVTMRNCPFADLARRSPDVVCGIHRGLVDGVLAGAGSDLVVERLDVFPRPGVCVLRLEPGAGGRADA